MLLQDTHSQKAKDNMEAMFLEQSQELAEASELLYEALNASYRCSGTCLEQEINGYRTNIRNLYWDCKKNMETALKGGKKTEFLLMNILEDTFQKAFPLLLVRLEDLSNGDFRQLDNVKRLQEIFTNNIYKRIWKEKAEQYQVMLHKMGFQMNSDIFKNLTEIMDPLLNAFTTYLPTQNHFAPDIYRVRNGKRADASPTIITDVCEFGSEKEFADAIVGCGKDCAVAFGAVSKTNRKVKDYFYEWHRGYPEERQSNYMCHDHLTEEEYLNQTAEYTRAIWLCVKCGEEVYLMKMPHHTGSYSNLSDESSMYVYGKRAGYAPYAVFFKDSPSALKDTTFLTVKKRGWHLAEIMDDMQKVWLPVFLNETIEKFFKATPDAKEMLFPEETHAIVREREGEATEIVPVNETLPQIRTWTYQIQEPEKIFQNDSDMVQLLRYFRVSSMDIADAPILPYKMGTPKEFQDFTDRNLKMAYAKVLQNRIRKHLEGMKDLRERILSAFRLYTDDIIQAVREGTFSAFQDVVIDGAKVFDKDGNPVMVANSKATNWNSLSKEIQEVRRTYTDDVKMYMGDITKNSQPYIYKIDVGEDKKPPVVIKIRPRVKSDYEVFLKVLGFESFPEILEPMDWIKYFYDHYYDDHIKEPRTDCLHILNAYADLNICMKKKTYKDWQKQKKE